MLLPLLFLIFTSCLLPLSGLGEELVSGSGESLLVDPHLAGLLLCNPNEQ